MGGALQSAEVSRSAPLPVGVDHISVDDVFVDYAGTLALLVHQAVELLAAGGHALLLEYLKGQVDREAVGVV